MCLVVLGKKLGLKPTFHLLVASLVADNATALCSPPTARDHSKQQLQQLPAGKSSAILDGRMTFDLSIDFPALVVIDKFPRRKSPFFFSFHLIFFANTPNLLLIYIFPFPEVFLCLSFCNINHNLPSILPSSVQPIAMKT